jgi:hypothetical protein
MNCKPSYHNKNRMTALQYALINRMDEVVNKIKKVMPL